MTRRLSEEALLTALHAWHLSSPRLVRRLPDGFTSEVWLVEAGGAPFVAKYAYQSQEALEAGLSAAELAEGHGLSSGVPLRTKEGALTLLVAESSGQRHPLALLRFVNGSPLDVAEPGAASLYGQVLGQTHTLLQGLTPKVTLDVYDFLLQEEAYVVSQPGLAELIHRACTAAREFEARREVTSGVIWADRVEIVLEKETGRVGVIDWGPLSADHCCSMWPWRCSGSFRRAVRPLKSFFTPTLPQLPSAVTNLKVSLTTRLYSGHTRRNFLPIESLPMSRSAIHIPGGMPNVS